MAQSALIKITVDPSKSIVTINGVKVALNDLEKAQKRVTGAVKDNNEAIEGSLKWHKMMVQKLSAEREALSTNSDEFDQLTVSIKKHNMAIAEITQNKELERAAIKGSFQDYENQISVLRRQQKQFADNNKAVLEYEERIQSLRAEQRKLTTGTRLTGKGMQSMSSSAGLAGAAATEFGRGIGDAQYGIQGISNNVQQLSALLTDLVQQEGSARKAFTLFARTLAGPAGVLVVISLVTTAIEYFIRKQKEAQKEVERLDLSLFAQGKTFRQLKDDLDNLNLSREEELKTLKTLALGMSDLKTVMEDENLTIDKRIELGRKLVKANSDIQKAELDVQKELEASNEAYKGLDITQSGLIKNREDQKKAELELADATGYAREGQLLYIQTLKDQEVLIQQGIEDRKKLTGEGSKMYEAQQAVNAIMEEYKTLSKDVEVIIKNSIKDYEKRIEKLTEELSNVDLNSEAYKRMAAELKVLETEYHQLKLTYSELIEEYLRGRDVFDEMTKEENDARLSAVSSHMQYLLRKRDLEDKEAANEKLTLEERLSLQVGTEKQRLAAAKAFLDNEKALEQERIAKQKESINNRIGMLEGFLRREGLTEQERLSLREQIQAEQERLNKLERDDAKKTADEIIKEAERKNQELMKTLGNIKDIASTINDFMESEAQREIDIETNKTNAINEQLRERLRNEQLSKEQRDQINQEIARNEAELVEKENAINEKRFNQAKAFNIAMAVIDTYVAANMALKDKTLVSTFARVAAMVAIIGKGLANVATISRQQFVGKVAKSPTLRGDGAPSGGDRVFNVVGAAPQTQIAEAIAAVEEKPVKAYVVSSEVTSAQELDRRIVEGASI